MGGPPLRAIPTAVLLLDLAGRRATGKLVFGDRTALLSEGELVEISAEPEDAPSTTRRAMFVARLSAALRTAAARNEAVPVLEPALRRREPDAGLPLAAIVLDAVASCASESDLAWLATQLNHRIALREVGVTSSVGLHPSGQSPAQSAAIQEIARAWAGLDRSQPRPAVSTILAKRPSAAPMLTALLRTGLAQLEAPGRVGPSRPAGTGTLPPPPPRLSILPAFNEPPEAPDLFSQLSVRPPLLRLDPGQAHDAGEPLIQTELPLLRVLESQPAQPMFDDPIEALEQRIAKLEALGAKGAERARAFVALADTWLQRLGSVERACRALREACAADPSDARALQQAALYCHVLGEEDLALRYAQSAVQASVISVERGSAQRLRATVLRAQGDREGLIEALCEAAADDPASPEPHEAVAALLESENREGANAHARLAAAGFQDSAPKRAMALLDWAFSLMPSDLPTVYEHASLLDAQGSRHAAVAVLAHAAELQTDPDARRKLRLSAAQRAEAAGRPDRAAELLEDALDAEPHFDLLYAPLDEDLAATGFAEHRAVVLEDIATACPEDQRALWLTRAAQVLLSIDTQREAALWIAFEAALVDGERAEPLELLRRHAVEPFELVLLAYALRAAASIKLAEGADSSPLLRELAHVAIERLDNPEFGLAALEQLARIGAFDPHLEALQAAATMRAAQREQELRDAERDLEAATLDPRTQGAPAHAAHCVRVASLLPNLPEAWPRRIELLQAALASGAPRAATVDALQSLYGLTRDAAGLAAFLEDQIDAATSTSERVRLLMRLSAVHAVREDPHAVAASCEQILAIDPTHRLAIARLMRAARRLGVPALWARALEHRVRIVSDPLQRARVLSRLARAHELAGASREAALRAIDALTIDPESSDAALVLLATWQACPADQALPALESIPKALCGSARAYAAIASAAALAKQPTAMARALESWTTLLPGDGHAHALRISSWPQTPPRDSTSYRDGSGATAAALHAAAQTALTACPSVEVQTAVRGAIERLVRAGHEGLAARLSVRLAEEQGRRDPALVQRAAQLAKRVAPELRTRALELWGAVEPEATRSAVWLELATHHTTLGDALGELRALLRVLEVDVAHPAALDRLRALFIAAGDWPHALSVATLRLDALDAPEQRRAALLDLAVLSAQQQDLERAELYVRRMVAESQGDMDQTRAALGVLLSLGTTEWAIERSCAIAEGCPEAIRARIHHACAATAELVLKDDERALELASTGAQLSPNYAPLLLMMERISLATGDAATAMRTYDTLIASAIGPHGHRALVYRAGRWLERAGELEQALRRYLVAFDLEPTAGAAFIALCRVAEQTGQVDRLLPCYERLADIVRHDTTRADLLRRAVAICLSSLDDPARAFALLRKAIASRDSAELSELAEQAATRLSQVDEDAGRVAWSELATDLESRASQLWEGPDKVRLLLRMGSIAALELNEPLKGLAHADEAVSLAEREQLGTELLAEALSQRERISALVPLELQPPSPREDATSTPSIAPVPSEQPEAAGAQGSNSAAASPAPSTVVSTPPPTHSSFPPVDRASAREHLLALIAREPWRTDALLKLHFFASAEPSSIDCHVAAAILSSFDPTLAPPAAIELHTGMWRPESLRVALGEDLPDDARRMLMRLWEAARTLPKFRVALTALGIQDRDRITRLTSGVVAEAYAQAARLLHAGDVPVFGMPSSHELGGRTRVIAAHPPVVLLARTSNASRAELSWEIGRALTLAMPERVIGGVLIERDARELLEAARLAFAPTTASTAGLSGAREQRMSMTGPKELAAALWQNIPAREQRELTQALTQHRALLTYDELHARAHALAARAGLLCSGQIRLALQSIAKLEDLIVRDEASFSDACRKSAAYAATVRCAVSLELREALGRARPSR